MSSHTSSLGDTIFALPDPFRGMDVRRLAANDSSMSGTTTASSSIVEIETPPDSSPNDPQSWSVVPVANSLQYSADTTFSDNTSESEYDGYPRWIQIPYTPVPLIDELLGHLHDGVSDIISEAIIWKHFECSDQKSVDLFTRIDPSDWQISRSSAKFLLKLLYSQFGFAVDFDLQADDDELQTWFSRLNALYHLWSSPTMTPYTSRVSYVTLSMSIGWDGCYYGDSDRKPHTAIFTMIRSREGDSPFACAGEVVTCKGHTHAVCICSLLDHICDVVTLETGRAFVRDNSAATDDEDMYRRAPGYILLEGLEHIIDLCRDEAHRWDLGEYLPDHICRRCGLAPIAEHLIMNHIY